jgi:hypothetical protein
LVVVVVESFFMVVSMFIFIDVSFLIPVSAGAGVIAGVVVVVDVESDMVLPVSFGLHAATASKAAITARRFIYDLLRSGGASSIKTPWSAHALVPGIGARKATYTAHHVKTSPAAKCRYRNGVRACGELRDGPVENPGATGRQPPLACCGDTRIPDASFMPNPPLSRLAPALVIWACEHDGRDSGYTAKVAVARRIRPGHRAGALLAT